MSIGSQNFQSKKLSMNRVAKGGKVHLGRRSLSESKTLTMDSPSFTAVLGGTGDETELAIRHPSCPLPETEGIKITRSFWTRNEVWKGIPPQSLRVL